MKLKLKKKKQADPRSKGLKPRIGEAKRFNLYVTADIVNDVEELRERAESLGCKRPVLTCSYAMREGARLFIREKNKELDRVERAEYHAKKRS